MNILVNKNIVFRVNKNFYNTKNKDTAQSISGSGAIFNIKNPTTYIYNRRG